MSNFYCLRRLLKSTLLHLLPYNYHFNWRPVINKKIYFILIRSVAHVAFINRSSCIPSLVVVAAITNPVSLAVDTHRHHGLLKPSPPSPSDRPLGSVVKVRNGPLTVLPPNSGFIRPNYMAGGSNLRGSYIGTRFTTTSERIPEKIVSTGRRNDGVKSTWVAFGILKGW